MKKKDTHKDLCLTCNNSPTCFLSSNDNTVFECEEYNDASWVSIETADKDANKQAYRRPDSSYSEKYKGLCNNCENRETCGNSATAGGVWHCEEYR